jgi:hypothetical protein
MSGNFGILSIYLVVEYEEVGMNRLLERSFTGEQYEGESKPEGDNLIEKRDSPLLRRRENMLRTGSAALNGILLKNGWLAPQEFQGKAPVSDTIEDSLHDSH